MAKEYTVKDIQNSILEIVRDINDFCRKYEIQYYLMGGSALGAMRHKGFIPWDDDLDIFMTVDQYQKFIELFDQYGNKEKYFLQKGNTEEWPLFLSRICLKGTTLISDEFKNNLKQHHNVFVDIMCLYSVPSGMISHISQYIASQMLRVNALALCGFQSKSKLKNMALKSSKIIVNPLTRPLLINLLQSYEGKDTDFVGHYFGRARYSSTYFPRDYLGVPRYVPFEDMELPVFEKVEDYLETRYGKDWMMMPSQEVRDKYPIHGDFVDLDNDYTTYMNEDRTAWVL